MDISTFENFALIKNYSLYPADNYMFKVNKKNTRTRCEICSKLTIKTPERRHWRRFGVFIVNFEHISHLVLMFLLLALSKKMSAVQPNQRLQGNNLNIVH